MSKVPYTNQTDVVQHIGPCTVWPGQTREIEESMLPGAKKEESFEPEKKQSEVIAEMLAHKVPEVVEIIPSLSDSELDKIEEAEKASANRTGVLSEISSERLARVDVAQRAHEYAESIAEYDLETLKEELESVPDEGFKGIVQEAIEKLTQSDD